MLGVARSVWLISEGLQRYAVVYTGTSLVVNVGLNFVLIPEFGAIGAVAAYGVFG